MRSPAIWGLLLASASAVVAERVVKRQVSSSTTSVFSIPTPTTLPSVNGSEHDLSQHFCRIWRHQSVYAEGKIYIDGGNTYIPDGNTTYYSVATGQYEQGLNDVLLVLDLSRNFTNQDSSVYSVIDKGPNIPNGLIEGALWYSKVTRKIYQLGGWFSFNNVADPGYITDAQLPASAIWEFDIDLKTWAKSAFNYVNTGTKVDRPGAAANCDAPSLNRSFIFEGYVQRRSDYAYKNYTVSSMFKFLEGMLQLDTNTSPPTLTNISVPTYVGPRMNGAMIHVPVGKMGVIVNIAGQTVMNPTPFGVPIENANAGNVNINNNFTDIYDIETGYWFRQATFGVPEIPTGRSDICTILVTAADQSSFNIFVIAGVQTYNSVIAYEDMWVLTIPTFQWVKVHTRPGGIYGHTCHAVGENLIVVGGMQTTSTGGNAGNCSSHMPAEIFSLVDMEYTGIFDYAGASRNPPVPSDVFKLIGGTGAGGAVVTKPKLWSDLYLQYVFDPTTPRPAYTPTYMLANETAASGNTSTSTSSASATAVPATSHIGPIVGGAVGGVVILALLITGIIILFKRRKAAKERAEAEAHPPPPAFVPGAELPVYQEYKDPHAVEVSAYQTPLVFAPYQPTHTGPVEMDAEEAQDELGALGAGTGAGPQSTSPAMNSPSRLSEVSMASSSSPRAPGLGSPTLPGAVPGRTSRQSDVSRDSTGA